MGGNEQRGEHLERVRCALAHDKAQWDATRASECSGNESDESDEMSEFGSEEDEDEDEVGEDEGLTLPAELMQDISAAFEAIVGAAVDAPTAAAAEEEYTDIGLSTFVPAALLNQFTSELGGAIVATSCAAALELLHGEGAEGSGDNDDDNDNDDDDDDDDDDSDDDNGDGSADQGESEGGKGE